MNEFEEAVEELRQCSERRKGCDNCPELKACLKNFDERIVNYSIDEDFPK